MVRASRAGPLPLEGLRERFLPEAAFRGRHNAKLRYAVLAAAAVHGGTGPDLPDEAASWQTGDFWQYAMYAAVAFIRAAAIRAGVPVRQACQDLGDRPGHGSGWIRNWVPVPEPPVMLALPPWSASPRTTAPCRAAVVHARRFARGQAGGLVSSVTSGSAGPG